MPEFKKAYPNNSEDDFIAAAVTLDLEMNVDHAGLIVKYKSHYKVMHFVNKEIHFDDIAEEDDWLFFKDLKVLDKSIAGSVYNICMKNLGNRPPQYGYLIENSLYNNIGEYHSLNNLPDITTCVGFCLRILKNALFGVDFIEFKDWDTLTNLDSPELIEIYVQKYIALHPDMNVELLRSNIRRILPIEYFVAAYFDNVPVRKAQIYQELNQVRTELRIAAQS